MQFEAQHEMVRGTTLQLVFLCHTGCCIWCCLHLPCNWRNCPIFYPFCMHSGLDFIKWLRCSSCLLISHMPTTFKSLNLCFSSCSKIPQFWYYKQVTLTAKIQKLGILALLYTYFSVHFQELSQAKVQWWLPFYFTWSTLHKNFFGVKASSSSYQAYKEITHWALRKEKTMIIAQ